VRDGTRSHVEVQTQKTLLVDVAVEVRGGVVEVGVAVVAVAGVDVAVGIHPSRAAPP